MTNTNELKKIFTQVSADVLSAYRGENIQPGGKTAPEELIGAIHQFFIIYERLGNQPASKISKDDISQIGEQAINCLIELASWADQLNMQREQAMLEEIALTAAHWVIRHQGEIRSLNEVVNMLAAKANSTSDLKVLSSLFHVMHDVIEHATPEVKSDQDKSDPARPWRMLNFNFAIVATLTMDEDLMIKAFDTLGRNLPEDCPDFFEEGLKQSEKAVYGPEIQSMMAEYFKKWATLH